MNANWGVRALHACVFGLSQGVPEPHRLFYCAVVVVSGKLEFTRSEAPSPVLVVTELRELNI